MNVEGISGAGKLIQLTILFQSEWEVSVMSSYSDLLVPAAIHNRGCSRLGP